MKLSVIVPVYNVQEYLERCLDSILSNDKVQLEVICVNDGSTDDSRHLIEKYLDDNRVVCIDQPNMGLSEARNTGLRAARGEYVLFVDSDDYVAENSFAPLIAKADSLGLDLLDFQVVQFSEEGQWNWRAPMHLESEPVSGLEYHRLYVDEYREQPYVSAWSRLYRRDFIINNELSFIPGKLYEDLPFTLEAYFLAKRVSFLKHEVYFYRRNQESITKAIPSKRQIEDLFFISRQVYELSVEFNTITPMDNFFRAILKKGYALKGMNKLSPLELRQLLKLLVSREFTLFKFKSRFVCFLLRIALSVNFIPLISINRLKNSK